MQRPITSTLSLALFLAGVCAVACSSDDGALFDPAPGQRPPEASGRARFAIVGGGLTLTSVEYVVTRGDAEVSSGEAVAPTPGAAFELTLDLAPGDDYRVAMTAHTDTGRECNGQSANFDVVAGASVEVAIALVCDREPPPPGHGQAHVTAEVVTEPPVTLRFEARVGQAVFACGQTYASAGSTAAELSPQDLRFFVHDVELIGADGQRTAIELDTRAPFQALGVALLDFEDGTAGCLSGDAARNGEITGRAPPGEYTGVAFRVGVPASVNHADPALAPAPLGAGGMTWGWLSGYKFLRAEVGSDAGSSSIHLGSAACSGDPSQGNVACARSNRAEVVLNGFSATSDRVIVDVGALFAGSDLAVPSACHGSGASCAEAFARLGLDLTTGQSTGAQSVFRAEQ